METEKTIVVPASTWVALSESIKRLSKIITEQDREIERLRAESARLESLIAKGRGDKPQYN